MVDFPIDVVIPWVDGSDPQWRARKNALREKLDLPQDSNSSDVRYRDWNLLPYLFRGIEEYAPWVRKVFLITDHQVPSWLDQNCPKLQLIYHEDYIPQEYLPTFSSHTIELNLHRIADLSEHFIYMNDDTFIMNPVKPEFFLVKKDFHGPQPLSAPGVFLWEIISSNRLLTQQLSRGILISTRRLRVTPDNGSRRVMALMFFAPYSACLTPISLASTKGMCPMLFSNQLLKRSGIKNTTY